jgi:hypothetical protein
MCRHLCNMLAIETLNGIPKTIIIILCPDQGSRATDDTNRISIDHLCLWFFSSMVSLMYIRIAETWTNVHWDFVWDQKRPEDFPCSGLRHYSANDNSLSPSSCSQNLGFPPMLQSHFCSLHIPKSAESLTYVCGSCCS